MADVADGTAGASRWLGAARLAVGLLQGLALYGLYRAVELKAWPSTDAPLFGALALALAFAPLVLLAGLGHLRRITLAIWTVVAAIAVGLFAAHAVANLAPGPWPQRFATFPVWAFAAAALFCGHHLIVPADAERRLVAPYPAYFDAAWLDGVRLVLAIAFTGAFWILLALGAALFGLIGLKGFGVFVARPEFYFPATGLMFAAAVQLADVRAGLTRGLRTVALVLLSWLLPVMGAIAVAFLIALPFTGLAVLWRAGSATGVLLGSIGALVVLINAAYQDGGRETTAPAALRWAARITAVALVPLAGVAVWGLGLRIGQHGLTPSRIVAAAAAAVAVCYALGYAFAAVRPGRWMARLEPTNIGAAVAMIAFIVALLTPIADPWRIAVIDQVARLERGAVTPARFDFDFLRFKAGRYGLTALKRLAKTNTGRDAAQIAALAGEALKRATLYGPAPATAANIAARIVVFPRGASLPADFLSRAASLNLDDCSVKFPCEAYPIDQGADRPHEILVRLQSFLTAYGKVAGAWARVGRFDEYELCPATIQALRDGRIGLTPPQSEWMDLTAGGQRLVFVPQQSTPICSPSGARLTPSPSPAASPPRRAR